MTISYLTGTAIGGNGTSLTTSNADGTGADLATVVFGTNAGSDSFIPTDNQGNSYTGLTRYANVDALIERTSYCHNPTVSSSMNWSVTASSGVWLSLCVLLFSGSAASTFDQETGGSGAVRNQTAPGAITSTAAELFISGLSAFRGSGFPSINITGTGWTVAQSVIYAGGPLATAAAYRIQSTPGTENPSWSLAFDSLQTEMASFKAAAGGAVALAGKTRYVMGGRGSRTGAASLNGIEKSRLTGRVPVRGATSLIGKERSVFSGRGSRIGSTILHGRFTAAVRGLASRTGTAGIVARARIAIRGRGSRTGIAHLAGRAAVKLSGGLSKGGVIALIARALMRVAGKGSRGGTATLHGQSRSRLSISAKGLFSRKLSARSQYRIVQKGNMVRMVPLRANMMTLTYARGSRTGTVHLSAVARLMARLRAVLRGPVQHLAPDPKYTVTQPRPAPFAAQPKPASFTATQQRPATFEVGE